MDDSIEHRYYFPCCCSDLIMYTCIHAGVVAFIEVRSNTENRFEGISKQIEMLGAKVS